MKRLSDKRLFNAYVQAKNLGLDPLFITLLEDELKNRSINVDQYKCKKTINETKRSVELYDTSFKFKNK